MSYTLDELRSALLSKVFEVYDVFKDFFGEAYVDLQNLPSDGVIADVYSSHRQGSNFVFDSAPDPAELVCLNPFILVWWPLVTVSNEHGRSVDIQDLFAKVPVTFSGMMPDSADSFWLNRSTYPMDQYSSDYMHSHVRSIPSNPEVFQRPCLGRGPINNTIASLHRSSDPLLWSLFCQELSMYVTVESLEGIPYKRLESIGKGSKSEGALMFTTYSRSQNKLCNCRKDFISWYLRHGHLKFRFSEGSFSLGMTPYDFYVDISNAFISWYNAQSEEYLGPRLMVNELFYRGIIDKKLLKDGGIYSPDSPYSSASLDSVGKHVCWFKGRDIRLKILDPDSSEADANLSVILAPDVASVILQSILKILNFRYKNGNSKNNENRGGNTAAAGGAASAASPHKNARYF